MGSPETTPVWRPNPAHLPDTQMMRFFVATSGRYLGAPGPADGYPAWHRWSIENPAAFWRAVWEFTGMGAASAASPPAEGSVLVHGESMRPPLGAEGPHWFTEARLNFAAELLQHDSDEVAVIARDERGRRRTLTFRQLREEVQRFAGALSRAGVAPGDRVGGFVPNGVEAVIAALAAASVGAIWSSCSPDFGARGVLDRFGQIAPRVLVAADGYQYAGKRIDCLTRVREIVAALPSLERVVIIPFLDESPDLRGIPMAMHWEDFAEMGAGDPWSPRMLPFDHPLYILYSSGTTGLPKCMVHGAGGTLLQHRKEHQLHTDLRPGDRMFYFTTCGWMMWNWLVSALASGVTIVLYDGAPMPTERQAILWELAAEEAVTVFGVSAKFLALSEKAGLRPVEGDGLLALRTILSTGSPLAEHSYDYVMRDVSPTVQLASISGGTDLISCFALGNPLLPVYRGELQCLGLGMAVEIRDAEGRSVVGEAGELVCTRPFPSMPVAFWDDPDGRRYRDAYFEHLPGVWRHGDWAELTARGGLVIHGRSDATLNPGGVRIGSAEIYRQVEQMPEILESVVVGQDVGEGQARDVRIVLFVRLRPGVVLDEALQARIRAKLRAETTPHHVPKVILQVADIPRTISGKISEIAVRERIHGRPVRNTEALANPESLALYENLPELSV